MTQNLTPEAVADAIALLRFYSQPAITASADEGSVVTPRRLLRIAADFLSELTSQNNTASPEGTGALEADVQRLLDFIDMQRRFPGVPSYDKPSTFDELDAIVRRLATERDEAVRDMETLHDSLNACGADNDLLQSRLDEAEGLLREIVASTAHAHLLMPMGRNWRERRDAFQSETAKPVGGGEKKWRAFCAGCQHPAFCAEKRACYYGQPSWFAGEKEKTGEFGT